MKNLRKMKDLAYQGDIALLKIKELPRGAAQVVDKLNSAEREAYGYHAAKGLVLAQGESRNHYHAFREYSDNVEMYEMRDAANDNKRLFLVVNDTAILQHEEHDPIEVAPNVYELFFQKEYLFEEEYVRVAD
jgi:hypothetical protein